MYTKKDLHDPDNHDGVITHLEPDPGMWSQVGLRKRNYKQSYFRWWNSSWAISNAEMMLWKYCTQYASKLGKLSSGHRTGKGQFSFQSQRKATPKNAQTTTQLHSSHTLVKWCSKIFQTRLQEYMKCELPDVQGGFRKGRGTRDQIANIRWITEKATEFQKNIYFCFIDYTKVFDCVDHNQLWKILRDGNTRPPDLPPDNENEKSVCRSRSNC